jgi:hypothetical protein
MPPCLEVCLKVNTGFLKLLSRKRDFSLASVGLLAMSYGIGTVYKFLLISMVLSFAAGITTTLAVVSWLFDKALTGG